MATTVNWTTEQKKRWFEHHPCKNKDGSEATARHKNGNCMHCGFCINDRCGKPPWCNDHRLSDKPRRKKPVGAIDLTGTPAKRPRRRANTISPMNTEYGGYSKHSATRMEEHDEEADAEREEGNKLGNLFQKDLNELGDAKGAVSKGSKLVNIVRQMINQLAEGDEEKIATITKQIVKGLDPSIKGFPKLKSNIADLIIDGSQNTRQVGKALLLSSFTDDQARQLLLDHDYSNRRQAQTVKNIQALNQQRRRGAKKKGVRRYTVKRAVSTVQFTAPFSKSVSNAKHRRNFEAYLARGVDIPNRSPTPKIVTPRVLFLVAFLYQVGQFRPGKIRNCRFHGHLFQSLPMYIRYSSIESLYGSYVSICVDCCDPINYNSFREIVNALTRKGTYNQGLSYYYVDFIDKIEFALQVKKRLLVLADPFKDSDKGEHLIELIHRLGEQIEEASRFLRHCYYGRLKESDPTNLYRSVKWALGSVDATDRPTPDPTDPLLVVLTLRLLLYEISDRFEPLLLESNNAEKDEELIEAQSLKPMADLLDFELLYYTKHLTRGWWQETQEKKIKRDLKQGQLFVTLDHKAKQYCIRKQESMTAYYGKQGMSMLGAMIQWRGEVNEEEGLHTYFLDIVMANTASQKAHDVMAGIETVVESIQSKEFRTVFRESAGATGSPKSIVLASDNALCNTAHTPFIQMLNSKYKGKVTITDWVNNEAQRGKSFLDGHFRFVSIHLKTAVLEGNVVLGNPEGFYECLTYKEGLQASAGLFLYEEDEAKEIYEACNKVEYDAGKTLNVHHISWSAGKGKGKGRVIHRHFTNMKTVGGGYKQFSGADLQPSEEIEELEAGTVDKSQWKRNGKKDVTIFLPFKGPGDSLNPFCCRTPDERDQVPPENTLAGLVYQCASWVHQYGITPDQLLDPDGTGIIVDVEEIRGRGRRVERQSRKIQDLIAKAKELAEQRKARPTEEVDTSDEEEDGQAEDPVDCSVDKIVNEFPPVSSFKRYWAIKKKRPPTKLDPKVMEKFNQMFDKGKGYQNKDKKFTAEKMTEELRKSPEIARRFDLQLKITPRLIQSKINIRATKDKKAADDSTKQQLDRRKKKAEEEEEYHSELDSDWEEDPEDIIDDFEDDLECEDIEGIVEEVEELAVEESENLAAGN